MSSSMIVFMSSIFLLLVSFTQAGREIIVGGNSNSWKIPPSDSSFNQWAEQTRFKVGDVLIWRYDPNADSVLEVTMEGYNGCDTRSPIKEHKDGNTKIELSHSGPFYFISGAQGSCEKGEKMIVVVLSEDHWRKKPDLVPAPAGAPPAPKAKGEAHALKGGGGVLGLWTVLVLGALALV